MQNKTTATAPMAFHPLPSLERVLCTTNDVGIASQGPKGAEYYTRW